jgi:8-oxo-dGTP pyrophosphatase MutT (NUDIX family)
MLFMSEQRVLLVERTWTGGLVLPGGVIERGEAPVAAAEREVREELGIEAAAGALLVHDTREGMDHYVFDGGSVPDLACLRPDYGGEIAAVRVLPIEEALARHVERGRPRLAAAIAQASTRRRASR